LDWQIASREAVNAKFESHMKPLLLILFLFSVSLSNLFAQSEYEDSLKNELNHQTEIAELISINMALGEFYTMEKKYSEEALHYFNEALLLCKETNETKSLSKIYLGLGINQKNPKVAIAYLRLFFSHADSSTFEEQKLLADAMLRIGKKYVKTHQFDSAEYFLDKTVNSYQELIEQKPENEKLIKQLARTYAFRGSMYVNQGLYDIAIDDIYSSMELYNKIGDSASLPSSYLNIGVIHYYNKDLENAEKSYQKAYEIAIAIDKLTTQASALTNLGNIAKMRKNYDRADSLFRAALSIRLKTGPETSIAGLYDNLGVIAKAHQEYDKALSYYNKSLEINLKNQQPRRLAANYANIANVYVIQKKYAQAIENMWKAYDYSKISRHLESQITLLNNLSYTYNEIGNYQQAFEIHKQFKALDDSVHSLKNQKIINELKEKYETVEKDKAISDYQQQQEVAKLQHEQQKLNNQLLGAGIIIILIVSGFIIYWVNQKRKADKAQYLQKQEFNRRKMLELVKEQEMNSVNSFIQGQERERSRIASDLHDRLGSLLSTVKLHFSSLEPYFEGNEEISKGFEYAISLLDQSVSEVRSVSHNLAKEILTEFGLMGAVENLRTAINSAGVLNLIFIAPEREIKLNYEVEIEIYRIIQELVTNAIKHANANELVIQFIADDKVLTLTVEDDGKGFDINNVNKDGLGLNNVFERSKKIKGKYSIDSAPNNGTSFIFDIPIQTEN
jgi:two-component system NarL family sensor kinase